MAQHQRITLQRVEGLIDALRRGGGDDYPATALADLFRLLVRIDTTLVKHEHTDIARQLRRAFDKAENNL